MLGVRVNCDAFIQ